MQLTCKTLVDCISHAVGCRARRVPVTLIVLVVAFAAIRPRTVEKTCVHETSAPVDEFSFCVCVLHGLRGCVCGYACRCVKEHTNNLN